jgi:hypothetical protein
VVQATSSVASSFYEFWINTSFITSSTTSVFTPTDIQTINGGDRIRVTVGSPGGCSATTSLTLIENIIVPSGTISTTAATICVGDIPPVLEGPLGTASGTIEYQWLQSPDNITFATLGTASTTGTFTPTTGLTTTTYFRRQIQSELNGLVCFDLGPSVKITVSAPPTGVL